MCCHMSYRSARLSISSRIFTFVGINYNGKYCELDLQKEMLRFRVNILSLFIVYGMKFFCRKTSIPNRKNSRPRCNRARKSRFHRPWFTWKMVNASQPVENYGCTNWKRKRTTEWYVCWSQAVGRSFWCSIGSELTCWWPNSIKLCGLIGSK